MRPDVQPTIDPSLRRSATEAAAIVAAAFAILLACLGSSLLNDPDTQWHIAVGRLIWTTGSVPQFDVFSHTFAGAPWVAKEWLSQLILYAAFSVGGWRGVSLLTIAVIAGSFGLLLRWLLCRVRWTVAAGMVFLALAVAAPEFVARPHILVLPVEILWLIELAAARERGTPPRWWAPGLLALWANMHASYPIGLVLASLFAAEAVLAAPASDRATCLLRWAAFLIVSVAAACVSPYGYRTILIVFNVVETREVMSYVQEWQSIGFDQQGVFAIAALALSVLVLSRHPRTNLFRAAAVVLLGYMMVRHARFALLFGMLTPIIIAAPVSRSFEQLAPEVVRVPCPGSALGVLAGILLVIGVVGSPEPNPTVTPTAAFQFARSKGLTGLVYNDYDYGGFLIFHGVKTFIDGRNDQLFLGGFSDRLNHALADNGNDGFAAILDQARVSWALVKSDSRDAQHLARMQGWSEVFRDNEAAVYARTSNLPT